MTKRSRDGADIPISDEKKKKKKKRHYFVDFFSFLYFFFFSSVISFLVFLTSIGGTRVDG